MRKESDFEAYLDTIKQYAAEEGYDSLDETFVEHLRCRFWGQDVVIGESARILLREMKMSDLEAFYAFEDAHKEPVLQAFIKESMEASKEHLQAYIEHMYSLYDYGMWTVLDKKSGEIIGICGLGQTAYQGAECTDLGYYICPKCRKQKYATECIEIVLDYAKNYLEFPVIYAIIKKENRISAGLLRKFGFQCIEMREKSLVFQRELAEQGAAMSKTKIICFANNKGGSGKSTTCSNVAYALTELGHKVLMVDGDMQMNLSLAYFDEEQVLSFASGGKNLYEAVKNQKDLTDYIIHTPFENLDLIPSSTLMSSIEYELFTKWQREFILKKCLQNIKDSEIYDYILIDAPPTLGGWVMNILVASDGLIIPVEASPWGLFGLANMFEFLTAVQQISPELQLMGIAVTKVDTRKNYFKQTMETLRELEDVHVFDTFIRVDSSIEWAQDNSVPVVAYKKSSRSAKEYMELTKEIEAYGSR